MAPSKRPGKDAGQISPHTVYLRGPMPLTEEQRRLARILRFDVGMDFADIAAAIGRSEADVRHALATARTRRKNPPRSTVNASPAAIDRLRALRLPGEAMWRTMNRMLGI